MGIDDPHLLIKKENGMWRDFNVVGSMPDQLSVDNITAVQLPAPDVGDGVKMPERVVVQTVSTNTAPIFIKNASDVAIDGSTGGYEMPPGANLILPLVDYTQFYLIASAGTQAVQVIYLAG